MKEFDVFGEFHGYFLMKSIGENFQDAVTRLQMKLNGYEVDMEKFKIPTLDGKEHSISLEDCDVEFSRENLDETDGYD